MDVKWINPFIQAFVEIMPQLGFEKVKKHSLSVKQNYIKSVGVTMNLAILGDLEGNVVYNMDIESAKQIASKMAMGYPVAELDEMAQSAISELSNMLTANASINFSNMDISTTISVPTLMYGEEFQIKTKADKIICVEMLVDGIPIEINVAIYKK